jgi:hypothetical protein
VGGEEAVAGPDEAAPLARERAGSEQHAAPEPAAEQVADVVAGDRGHRREQDHDRDAQPTLGGEHGGGHQRRLGRDRHADRFERDRDRDRDVPDVTGDADDAHRQRPG